MPRIPRILPSERTITPDTPGRQIRGRSATGDVLQILGKTAEDVGERLKRANLLTERTKAENQLDITLRDIESRAFTDPDTSETSLRKYESEMQKAIGDSSKHINIPEERSFFELQSESKQQITKSRVQGFFAKKRIDEGKAEIDIFMDNKLNEFIQAESVGAKEKAIVERDMKLKEAVQNGFITPAAAKKAMNDMDKKWGKAQVEYDIETKPLVARELLKSKAYPNISEIERVKFLKDVDVEMRKRSRDIEEDIYSKFLDETLTFEEVEAFSFPKEDGGIGSKTAKTIIGQMQRKQNAVVKDISRDNKFAEKYVNLVDRMVTIPTDNFNAKKVLVEAMADGVIEKDEANRLKEIRGLLNDLKWNKSSGPLVNSVKFIKSWFNANNPTDEDLAVSLRKLITDDQFLTNPQEVAENIIEQEKPNANDNAGKFKINDVIDTPMGPVKVIGFFPDGEPDVQLLQ